MDYISNEKENQKKECDYEENKSDPVQINFNAEEEHDELEQLDKSDDLKKSKLNTNNENSYHSEMNRNSLDYLNPDSSEHDNNPSNIRDKKIIKNSYLICLHCGGKNSKQNLLKCYICKELKCKNCISKETHNMMKKRDNSSYICEVCFISKNEKIRKKNSIYQDHIEMIHRESKNLVGKKRKNLNDKFGKEINYANKDSLLDLDLLHNCVSPPTELSDSKHEIETRVKRGKRSVTQNINYRCHSCLKISKFDCIKCEQVNCNIFFCNKCIKKYDDPFTTCYVCMGNCKCKRCESKLISDSKNSSNQNIVKIDDYVIIEDTEEQPWNKYEMDEDNYNKMMISIRNVEGYKPHGGKIYKYCLLCNEDRLSDCGMYKFKSLEEFLFYCKYYYNQEEIKNDDVFKKSSESFKKIFTDFLKYYHSDYNFKSIKFVCKLCFNSTLKTETGFNEIYNALHVGTNASNKLNKKKELIYDDNSNNIPINISQDSIQTQTQQKNISFNIDNQQKNIIINMNEKITEEVKTHNSSLNSNSNNNSSIQLNINPNLNNSNSQNDNISKMMEIINQSKNNENSGNNQNKNNIVQPNKDVLTNINLLNNILNTPFINSNTNNDMTQNSKNNQDEAENLNITNIFMNFDHNKQQNNVVMNNVLEELKKQFFSIQYYSLLQKLFISYVFKNLEIFLEQISKSQSLGDKVINNMINSVPQIEGLDQNIANQLLTSISEQMIILRNINKYGFDLTNELNMNFEQLKNNGIRLFKSMDPNIRANLSSSVQNMFGENIKPGNENEIMKNIIGVFNKSNNDTYDSILNGLIKNDTSNKNKSNNQNTNMPIQNTPLNMGNIQNIHSNTQPNMHTNIPTNMHPNLLSNVPPNMNTNLTSNMQSNIQSNMSSNMQQNIPNLNNMTNINNLLLQNMNKNKVNNMNQNNLLLNRLNNKSKSGNNQGNQFMNNMPSNQFNNNIPHNGFNQMPGNQFNLTNQFPQGNIPNPQFNLGMPGNQFNPSGIPNMNQMLNFNDIPNNQFNMGNFNPFFAGMMGMNGFNPNIKPENMMVNNGFNPMMNLSNQMMMQQLGMMQNVDPYLLSQMLNNQIQKSMYEENQNLFKNEGKEQGDDIKIEKENI